MKIVSLNLKTFNHPHNHPQKGPTKEIVDLLTPFENQKEIIFNILFYSMVRFKEQG